ncbi:cupin domain-containing protein [Cellulomonas sp. ICMP 17802]|uniref:cupin domain-containing protein n=1 Tax=Cellulomonas sp. ICMP 17802 TaxID=3239199 RepID=UPI00351B237C
MHLLQGVGRPGASPYTEHLRVPALSVGTYVLRAGDEDSQQPHTEDEIYVVLDGRARLWTPGLTVDVGPGDVAFVPALEPHRFVDITQDLTVLVVFGPAERSAAGGPG